MTRPAVPLPDAGSPGGADLREEAGRRQHRGTRQLLLGRLAFIVCGYVVTVLLARGLGPVAYGVYGVLLSFLIWLEMITGSGVAGAASKLIPDHPDEAPSVERAVRAVVLFGSLLLFGALWLAAPVLARVFRIDDGAFLFRIAALDMPLYAIYVGYQGILTGDRRFGPLGVCLAMYGVAKMLGVLLLVVVGMSVARALVVNAAATGVVVVFLLVRFPPSGWRPRFEFVRRLIAVAVPIAAYAISLQVLLSLDLWSLKSLGSDARSVGQYVAGLSIAKMLAVIPAVQSGVLFASVAWAFARGDRSGAALHLLEASRFVLIIVVPACLLVGLDGGELMSALFSEAYREGGRYLAIQLIAFGLFAYLDTFFQSLMATGRIHLAPAVLLALLPVVAVSNWLLVPRFGPMGAATSLAGGVALGTLLAGTLARRRFGRLVRPASLARVLAAAAVVGLLSRLVVVPGAWVVAKLAVLGGLYLLLLWRMGEISGADFRFVRLPVPRSSG